MRPLLAASLALAVAACASSDPASPPRTPTSSGVAPSAAASAAPTDIASTAAYTAAPPPASAAASPAPAPTNDTPTGADPRGIKAGMVPVISYRSPEVPNKCFAFYGTAADKAQMTDEKALKFLKGFGKKGQKGPTPVVVPSCPTEHLTGFCYVTMLDVSESYYSATGAAAAKKKCVPPDGVWSE
jgi:hypothetical protein